MNKTSINLIIVVIYSITPVFLSYIDKVYRSKNIELFDHGWIYGFPLIALFVHLLTLIGLIIYNFDLKNNNVAKEYFGTIFMTIIVSIVILVTEAMYFFGQGF